VQLAKSGGGAHALLPEGASGEEGGGEGRFKGIGCGEEVAGSY